jgi:hypothetical protein
MKIVTTLLFSLCCIIGFSSCSKTCKTCTLKSYDTQGSVIYSQSLPQLCGDDLNKVDGKTTTINNTDGTSYTATYECF